MWSAKVTVNREFPPRPRPEVLHLMPGPADGYADVTAPADFRRLLEQHKLVGSVIVYDSRFPQRPIPWQRFLDKHLCKIWDEGELLAAFQPTPAELESEARRVANPAYTPTLAEAMRHPKEFLDGFTEQ